MANLDNIPAELQGLKQWVIYRNIKIPIDAKKPLSGGHASTTDPATWSSFEKAREAIENHNYRGPGFVFTENDPYCGIDLDDVIDDDGHIDPEAQAIIDKMDSYTEVSQSGHGIHIIVRAKKPGGRCRKDNVEVYEKGRYFALTGNLWQDRGVIEDRQAELDTLYEEVLGGQPDAEPVAVDDLVFDPDANPPPDKLAELIEDDEVRKVWEHKARLSSISDYDWHLALAAIEAGWENQEIADLIIAFRRQHGKADDLAKALRKDYIPRTIARAKQDTGGAGVLALLPFKVVKVLQYGEQDAEIWLVLDNGKEISMGTTDRYVSPRLAQARLVESQLGLPSKALKRWNEIVLALQPLMKIVETTSREDDAMAWLYDYVSSRVSIPRIERDGDIGEIFGEGRCSMALDKEGRLYLRLPDATKYAKFHTGMPNVNTRAIARDLVRLGFEKRKPRDKEGKQIRLWVSQAGFIDDNEGVDA